MTINTRCIRNRLEQSWHYLREHTERSARVAQEARWASCLAGYSQGFHSASWSRVTPLSTSDPICSRRRNKFKTLNQRKPIAPESFLTRITFRRQFLAFLATCKTSESNLIIRAKAEFFSWSFSSIWRLLSANKLYARGTPNVHWKINDTTNRSWIFLKFCKTTHAGRQGPQQFINTHHANWSCLKHPFKLLKPSNSLVSW